MLSTDQLKDLALFNSWQAMQSQILAAKASQAAEQMSEQLRKQQVKDGPAPRVQEGVLAQAIAASTLQHAGADDLK